MQYSLTAVSLQFSHTFVGYTTQKYQHKGASNPRCFFEEKSEFASKRDANRLIKKDLKFSVLNFFETTCTHILDISKD